MNNLFKTHNHVTYFVLRYLYIIMYAYINHDALQKKVYNRRGENVAVIINASCLYMYEMKI